MLGRVNQFGYIRCHFDGQFDAMAYRCFVLLGHAEHDANHSVVCELAALFIIGSVDIWIFLANSLRC